MTSLKAVLFAFWSRLDLPAYLSDCVPDDAQLPYLTYSVTQPALNSSTVLTVFNWHRRDSDGNTARSGMMGQIAQMIPVGGVMLPVDDGYIILRRNDADFQMDWQDDTDRDVIAGRTSYILTYYNV